MKKGSLALSRLIVYATALLAGFFTSVSVDHAEANGVIWQDITATVIVTRSTPLYDVARNVSVSSVTVKNSLLSSPINGRLRAVITSSTKTPLAQEGVSTDGKPYYNLVTDPNAVLGAGQSTPQKNITFTTSRGVLTYTVRIEKEQGVVNQADLAVTKAVDNATPLVGSNVAFTVMVTNNGPQNATDVQVTDLLPSGYTLVSANPGAGSYNIATHVWTISSLNNGAGVSLQIIATVLGTGNYINTATLTASNPADPNAANNQASVGVTAQANRAPVANAGPDQTAPVGATITLNGSSSSDAEGDPLTFNWSFISRPAGSGALLVNPTSVTPTFSIDAAGSYVVQLVVNDGKVNSAPDTVTISTSNSKPVANAGPDQTVYVTQTVQLNGSGSTDIDGNPLTYSWLFTARPAGSSAVLSAPAIVNPTFMADKFGTYTLQLIVNDGLLDSNPDTISISTLNSPPVANAGPNQTVTVGALVQLTGAGSTDVDGNPLTYRWSITSKPVGALAALSATTIVNPTFTADKFGTYVIQLIVNDGTVDSPAVTVTISTENSPPVANAGPPQTVPLGSLVNLDGSGSSDPDLNPITYLWSIVSKPAGSSAVLSDQTVVNPGFLADKAGSYTIQLIVNDGTVNSTPATVIITTQNSRPVANAGSDQSVVVGATVQLNGSASNDADGDPLTYSWSFTSKPGGSIATLTNPTTVNPTFVADLTGTYVVQLIVNDGLLSSTPVTVTMSATAGGAAKLAFIQHPSSTVAGQAISPAVTVQVQDASGNIVTTATDAVTIAILNNPGGATLSGTKTVNASSGVASFGDLSLDKAATGYTLNATGSGLAAATSNSFNVIAPLPTSVTLTPSPAQMFVRGSLTMTATLDSIAPPGGQLISLSAGSLLTAPASITIPAGSLSTTFTVTSGNDNGTADVNASAAGLVGSTATVNVQLRSFTLVSPLVGINRAVTATITLDQPAIAGGATFNLSVADTGVASVSSSSIIIPAGQLTGTFQLTGGLSTGYTSVTADGTASGYVSKTINISVTDHLIDLQSAADAYLGTTLTVPLLIGPDSAQAGGLVVTVTSSNPAVIQVLTPSVTVPEGTFQTTVQVRAVTGAAGSATITASNPDYAPDVMQVTIKSGLNIMESFSNFAQAETDTLHIQLQTDGVPYPAAIPYPASEGGVFVTLISSDTSCVSLPASMTITAGETFISPTLSYGGTAALPCTATVAASNNLFGGDTVQVTVGQTPDLGAVTITDPWQGYFRVGSGLQKQLRVNLATANHGGVTVQIKGDNPAVGLVATNAISAGDPVIELMVPDGDTYADFYLQGKRSQIGDVTLIARVARFSPNPAAIKVVQPVFTLNGLPDSTTSLSANDPFYAYAYILNAAGTAVQTTQEVSAEGALPVTFTSSNGGVGQIAKTGSTAASVTITMAVGATYTPTSVATGGVAFDPMAGGSTTVSVSAAGFNNAWSGASQAVTVIQPDITITDPWQGYYRVGGGLQKQLRVTLGGANHGGVTVHLESSNGGILKLSTSATVAGSAAIDIPIADGSTYADFYAQGVRNATGDVTVTATQALFTSGNVSIKVVQPVFTLNGLPDSTTSLSANDPFYAYAYILNAAGTAVQTTQEVSAEGALPVTFTSSDGGVGQIAKTGTTAASVTITMAVGATYTPTSVAAGGVAFDPMAGGSITVSVSAAGFNNAWSGASQAVTVTQPDITITDPWQGYYRVGGGLQKQLRVTLGGANHGGVTVHLESSNGGILKLSTSATVAGSAAIDIPIADGSTYADFYAQGVRNATGDVTVTATQALFTSGNVSIKVVQPVFVLGGLPASTTSLSANDPFYAYAYILNAAGTAVQTTQEVSAEGALPVTFTSSDGGVGQIAKTGTTAASVTITMAVGATFTPTSVAAGGVAFDPMAGGSTTVSVSASGFNNVWSAASQAVTVTQPDITITDPWQGYYRVGGGLQKQLRVTLGGANHGGVTVHLESSNGGILKLSTSATVAGSAAIDIPIADGSTYADFYAQGVRNATGDATVTATQALFTSGNVSIKVVQPVFTLNGLPASTTSLSANDPFYAYAYILNTAGTALQTPQEVSAEGALAVTFTSSNSGVGQIAKTGTTAASVTITMAVGATYTPTSVATGGVAFDPMAGGSTTVSVTAAGFNNAWSAASQAVTVTQPDITITDPWQNYFRVGGGLQKQLRVTLGGANHGGVTVRVASSETTKLLISVNAATPGTSFIDIPIADGSTSADFYVQGVLNATGDATVTATQALFTSGNVSIKVVQPVFVLSGLADSTTSLSANDPFYAYAYILNAAGTAVQTTQEVSAVGALAVTFTSSDGGVGQIAKTGTTAASVTITMAVGAIYTPTSVAAGGVAFDPMAGGSTTVSVSAPGFNNAWSAASQTVTVTP